MSGYTTRSEIENLSKDELAEALEFNGYGGKCVVAIRTNNIDGEDFLKLTEVQISLWRLPPVQASKLRSFIEQVKRDPKQLIINSKSTKNMAPKVNSFKRSTKVTSNLPTTSNLLPNKPHVAVKSNISDQFEGSVNVSGNSSLKRRELNSSTLTKQESLILKHKLAHILKSDLPEALSTSINNQNQPPVPPKPSNLKVAVTNKYDEFVDNPDDLSDGYLSPIQIDPNKRKIESPEVKPNQTILRSNSVGGSFLYKFRKNYEHLENRPGSVDNDYEEQKAKPQKVQGRPLPPIPVETVTQKDFSPDIELETDDEDLAEYTPVIEDNNTEMNKTLNDAVPVRNAILKNSCPTKHSQTTFESDDEELAEYTKVVEDDINDLKSDTKAKLKIRKPTPNLAISHTLPPRTSVSQSKTSSTSDYPRRNLRPQLPSPDLDKESPSKPILNTETFKTKPHFKTHRVEPSTSPNASRSHTLPKPPRSLPKPPINLLEASSFAVISQDVLVSNSLVAPKPQHRPLPAPPPQKLVEEPAEQNVPNVVEDELEIYSEIDLAIEPNYRETDRKGARQLLTGLPDGAYVIRPSRKTNYICTLSIMHNGRMFNLGIEKNSGGTFVFGSVATDFDQPKFQSVGDIIKYYSKNPLYLSGESIILRDILPRPRR